MLRFLVVLSTVLLAFAVQAQERSKAILVLDGSGSMWGQIDGVAKITIAQQVIGELLAVEKQDIQDSRQELAHVQVQQSGDPEVPAHLFELYARAGSVLTEPAQRQAVAHLLQEYEAVFSRGEDDLGLTDQVQHEIPIVPGPNHSNSHHIGSDQKKRQKSNDRSKVCCRRA